jgi:predicted transcriptional regulator
MSYIKFSISLEGRSNLLNPSLRFEDDTAARPLDRPPPPAAPPGSPGKRSVVCATANHDRIELIEGGDRLRYALQSSVAGEVVFKAEIIAEDDGTFREVGTLSFGDGQDELRVSSAGTGTLLPGTHPGRTQGAATLRIDGGTGAFKGATGLVTQNFLVDDEGAFRDVHTAVISLGEGQGGGRVQGEERMRVRNVIDEKAFPVTADVSMEYVADLLVLTKATVMMVVDNHGNFVGVVSEVDLLRAVMPDVDSILDVEGTLNDALRVFIANGRTMAAQPIRRLVNSNPRTVAPDDELLAVATVMLKTDVRRLPVVEDGKFLGSISMADICWAVMSKWNGLMQQ